MELLIRIGVERVKKFIAEIDTMIPKYQELAKKKCDTCKIKMTKEGKYVKFYVIVENKEEYKKIDIDDLDI